MGYVERVKNGKTLDSDRYFTANRREKTQECEQPNFTLNVFPDKVQLLGPAGEVIVKADSISIKCKDSITVDDADAGIHCGDIKVENAEKALKGLRLIANSGLQCGDFKIALSYEKSRTERLADTIRNNFNNGAVHILLTYPKERGKGVIHRYINAIQVQSDQKYIYVVEPGDIFFCHIITEGIDERTAHDRAGGDALVWYERIKDIEVMAERLARYITIKSIRCTMSKNIERSAGYEQSGDSKNADD